MAMKPRILMVISHFYPHFGGAEQQALNVAKALMARGVSVTVLTRKTEGLKPYEIIQGIPVHRKINVLPLGKLFGLTYMLTAFLFLVKMRRSYDIIHCHLAQGFHCPAALLCKALFNKHVIIKVGATGPLSDFETLKKVLFGKYFLKLLRHADRLVAVCSQAQQDAQKNGIPASRLLGIPNGVDIDYFKPAHHLRINNLISFVGRLDNMKGVDVLLNAFSLLKKKQKDALLYIVGNGPDREKLEAMARDLSIKERVVFTGEIHAVLEQLQKSAVFVLPSFSEGLSNVVLEAMACGLPVVATNAGGTIDIINHGENGILIDPRDANQLSDALLKILSDQELGPRLGSRARMTVAENFSLNRVVDKYIELYSAVTKT